VENYFKRIAMEPTASSFMPRKNKEVIQVLLQEYGKCFNNDKQQYKQKELQDISRNLDL
jgi:hypothetical protein